MKTTVRTRSATISWSNRRSACCAASSRPSSYTVICPKSGGRSLWSAVSSRSIAWPTRVSVDTSGRSTSDPSSPGAWTPSCARIAWITGTKLSVTVPSDDAWTTWLSSFRIRIAASWARRTACSNRLLNRSLSTKVTTRSWMKPSIAFARGTARMRARSGSASARKVRRSRARVTCLVSALLTAASKAGSSASGATRSVNRAVARRFLRPQTPMIDATRHTQARSTSRPVTTPRKRLFFARGGACSSFVPPASADRDRAASPRGGDARPHGSDDGRR